MINIYDKGLKWPSIMNIILLTLFVFKQACTCEGFFIISILIHSWRILKKKWRINLCSIILLHTIFFFNLIFISSVQLFGNYFIYTPPHLSCFWGGGVLLQELSFLTGCCQFHIQCLQQSEQSVYSIFNG